MLRIVPAPPPALYQRFYEVVRRIPPGRVATYGQVATVAGLPRHARHVGFALRNLPDGSTVPWHRVLGANGRVSLRAYPGPDELQRRLLEDEGVEFSARGRVDLERFRWDEDEIARPARISRRNRS